LEQGVLESYSSVFSGVPAVADSVNAFTENNDRSEVLLKKVAVPITVLVGPKKESQAKLEVSTKRMAGLGISIATNKKEEANIAKFTLLQKKSQKCSAWGLYQYSVQIAADLETYGDDVKNVGLTIEEVKAYKKQAEDFGKLIESTKVLLKDRKSARQELKGLLKDNSKLLKSDLDPFVNYRKESNPDLYREYWIAHKIKSSSKKKPDVVPTMAKIEGTVFDSQSGHVVEGAVIEIVALKLMTKTDAYGKYSLENVPDGDVLLSCHAMNYKLPEAKKVTIEKAGNATVNFSLMPESVIISGD